MTIRRPQISRQVEACLRKHDTLSFARTLLAKSHSPSQNIETRQGIYTSLSMILAEELGALLARR